jgi:hypothetical protein
VCLAMTLTWAGCSAGSQPSVRTEGTSAVHLATGDGVAKVLQALYTGPIPGSGGDTPIEQLRFAGRGIWVFFNDANQASQFRFDAPFGGDIHGARIGASVEQVQTALGSPSKPFALPSGTSYIYHPQPGLTIRCDFDVYGTVETIRVLTGEVTFAAPEGSAGRLPLADREVPLIVPRASADVSGPPGFPRQTIAPREVTHANGPSGQKGQAIGHLMTVIGMPPPTMDIHGLRYASGNDLTEMARHLALELDPGNPGWNLKHPKWQVMMGVITADIEQPLKMLERNSAPFLYSSISNEVGTKLDIQEIAQLTEFFESPVGKRYLALEEKVDIIINRNLAPGVVQSSESPPDPGKAIVEQRMRVLLNGTTARILLFASEPNTNVGGFGGAEFYALTVTPTVLSEGKSLDQLTREFGADLPAFEAFSRSATARKYLRAISQCLKAAEQRRAVSIAELERTLKGQIGAKWQLRYRAEIGGP